MKMMIYVTAMYDDGTIIGSHVQKRSIDSQTDDGRQLFK